MNDHECPTVFFLESKQSRIQETAFSVSLVALSRLLLQYLCRVERNQVGRFSRVTG